MTTRLALLDLIIRNNMDATNASKLWRLAGFEGIPARALERTRLGLTVVGAGCAGLGLIFWVAANWNLLDRTQQFILLQVLVFAPCIGLATYTRGRAALGLLALIATGGLFAYFGQTYQTGADPWQLFIVWAALTLPLAYCVRADVVWSAWGVIALIGIILCERAYGGQNWNLRIDGGTSMMIATTGAASLALALRTIGRRFLGIGPWTCGVTLILTASWVTSTSLSNLDGWSPAYDYYWFSVAMAVVAGALLAHAKPFDIFSASVVALCLNILLVGGMASVFLKGSLDNWIISLLFIGVMATTLLAGSIKLILSLARTGALPKQREEQP